MQMIGQLIRGLALLDGSTIYTSNPDEELDYEGYIRLFSDEAVQEITINTEDSFIFAKKYDQIIIILNLSKTSSNNKIGSISFLLLRARVITRELHTLYTKHSPEIGIILRYKIELEIAAAPQPEMLQKQAGPRVEKVVSRFRKKEPLIVRVKSSVEENEAEKREPPVKELQVEAAPRKQDSEAKPRLIDSLALGLYHGAAKKEIKTPADSLSEPVADKVEPGSSASGTEKVTEKRKEFEREKGEPQTEKADDEELQALAKEIIRFKRAWAETKKKTDVK